MNVLNLEERSDIVSGEKNMIRSQIAFERTSIIMRGQGRRDCGEGFMSRAQLCDMEAPRRLNESNAPYFRKRLTSTMLKKSERLSIPKGFVQAHGDRFRRVLSLTGPNGKPRSVTLVVRGADTQARVYLWRGWIGFAKENGFQVGDEVIFCLVASSSFRVLLCSPQSLEMATNYSSKGDEASDGTSNDAITTESAPQHPKLARQPDLREGTSASITNHEEIQVPPCQVINSNTVQSQVPTCCVAAVPPERLTSKVLEEEYVKYPGLNSAANSRFPQFVKRLTPSYLNGLELPVAFAREHVDKLQKRVTLLGATDHLRVVDLRVTTFGGQGRVHLGKGWKEFSLENGFSEGDVLLFSLVGVSTFVVKMFPGASECL